MAFAPAGLQAMVIMMMTEDAPNSIMAKRFVKTRHVCVHFFHAVILDILPFSSHDHYYATDSQVRSALSMKTNLAHN